MPLVVLGRGWHEEEETTRLPDGARIDFFPHTDTPFLISTTLSLLRSAEFGDPTDTVLGGRDVPNYRHIPFAADDVSRARRLHHLAPDTPLYVLDRVRRLCTTPFVCTDRHGCDGLLGQANRAGHNHLQILGRRMDAAEAPAPADDRQWLDQHFLRRDFHSQLRLWQSLPDERRARLAAHEEVAGWLAAYQVWAAYGDKSPTPAGLAKMINDLDEENRARLLAIAGVRRYIGSSERPLT